MIQRPRKYPFKKLEMTITRLNHSKFEYIVYENGKRLTSRIDYSNDYIACFVMKNHGRFLYSMCHMFRRVDLIGWKKPNANPYAIGLLKGIEITEQHIAEHPRIIRHFLNNTFV